MIRVVPVESKYFSLLSYILTDEKTGECMVVDPAKEMSAHLETSSKIKVVINTHIHFDHTLGNSIFDDGTPVIAHELENRTLYRLVNAFVSAVVSGSKAPKTSFCLKHDEILNLGETEIKVLHTPGHSPGSICLSWEGNLVSGDTMFIGGIGRTDIPHGSSMLLKESLKKLLELPGETLIWPGHAYTERYPVRLDENRRAITWMMNSL